jgi:hypothetical protein
MNGRLQQWDACAPAATADSDRAVRRGEKWSYRKSLAFVLGSSAAGWAGILFLLHLAGVW